MRPGPRYNIVSIGAPFLGGVSVVMFLWISGVEGHWHWTWRGPAAMSILASSCVAGLVSGLLALARSERLWGLTALDLLINIPLPLTLLWTGLSQLGAWLRYG